MPLITHCSTTARNSVSGCTKSCGDNSLPASIAGITGNRGQVNYSAAKGALHAASKSLALELASRGITVNAVAPGIIATDMIEGSFDPEAIKNLVPMKRAGKPEEVADLVAFLASDSAAYISGQVISINGGMI